MPRSRTSNRRKSSLGKVSMKPKSRAVPKTSRLQNSSLEYDEKASQFANYQRLGLLYDSNQIGAVRDRVTGFKPRVKGPVAQASSSEQPAVSSQQIDSGDAISRQQTADISRGQ